jgi:hypothetical protein
MQLASDKASSGRRDVNFQRRLDRETQAPGMDTYRMHRVLETVPAR